MDNKLAVKTGLTVAAMATLIGAMILVPTFGVALMAILLFGALGSIIIRIVYLMFQYAEEYVEECAEEKRHIKEKYSNHS